MTRAEKRARKALEMLRAAKTVAEGKYKPIAVDRPTTPITLPRVKFLEGADGQT